MVGATTENTALYGNSRQILSTTISLTINAYTVAKNCNFLLRTKAFAGDCIFNPNMCTCIVFKIVLLRVCVVCMGGGWNVNVNGRGCGVCVCVCVHMCTCFLTH